MALDFQPTKLDTDGYADTREPEQPTKKSLTAKSIIKTAHARWKLAEDADEPQRKREREDLAFYEGEGQWPEEIKNLRKGQQANNGMPAIPARPCLTINLTKEPVRHVTNEFIQTDLGIFLVPADDFGGDVDEKEIELREGLARRIQRQKNASSARIWAAIRATICGRGFYGLIPRYVDRGNYRFDQEIDYRRFYNQFCVMLDPAHQEPDGSDAEFGFVGTDVPKHVYDADHGRVNGRKNPLCDVNDSEWRALGDEAPGWFKTEGDLRSYRVAEYWWIERDTREIAQRADGTTAPVSEIPPEELALIPSDLRRYESVKTVHFAKIDGKQVLEQTIVPGTRIPIIKVVGEEIQPFDDERRDEGMVRPMRDSGQGFNVMISAAVETIGLAPKAPVVGAAGQFEGFEQQWDAANTRTIGRLEYNVRTDATGGQLLPPPQRQVSEPPIQAMAQMMGAFKDAIRSTSAIPDPTLGNVNPAVRSGKAINALIETSLQGTSNFMANLVRSAHYEGEIVNEWLYPIYGKRPGRVLSMMQGDKESRVMIGQPFVTNTQGRPEAFDAMKHQGQEPQEYKLTENGSFNVAIKVSKQADLRREQLHTELGEMIGRNPEAMSMFGDIFFATSDVPEHQELAKRAKVMLAPPIQQYLAGQQPDDPRLAQMQQQLQQLQGELQKQMADKGAKIESAQIKAQSDAQRSEMDNAVEIEKARIQAAAQIAVAEIKAATASMQEQAEAIRNAIAAASEQRLEHTRQSHDAAMSHSERAHDAASQMLDHAHQASLSSQEHGQSRDAAEHDAILNPPMPEGAETV